VLFISAAAYEVDGFMSLEAIVRPAVSWMKPAGFFSAKHFFLGQYAALVIGWMWSLSFC
jgi:hypothetical protein